MGKNEKAPFIVLNDVEYDIESMTTEQKMMVDHLADLDRKIGSTQFNLDQMAVGREAFITRLHTSLTTEKPEVEVVQ